MTLSILVFNFYPLTATMIVLLALLNDGAILSIAYDRAQISPFPERWDMHRVLGVATALGLVGVIESFGLFFLAEEVFKVNRETIQTIMYLKLSVAGHLMIFVARKRGPLWSDRPSVILLVAVISTQIVATLISVYGLFMNPIGWKWAGIVWGYVMIWLFILDAACVYTNRIFDRQHPGLLTKKRDR